MVPVSSTLTPSGGRTSFHLVASEAVLVLLER